MDRLRISRAMPPCPRSLAGQILLDASSPLRPAAGGVGLQELPF